MIRISQQRKQLALLLRILATAVFFSLPVSSLEAQTKAKSFASEVRSTIQAAQKEGSLNLSWGTTTMGGPSGVKELEQAFNKYYGTNIQFRYTPGRSYSAHMQRLAEEFAAGRQAFEDVALSDSGQVAFFNKNKILSPANWQVFMPHVPKASLANVISPDTTLVTLYSQPRTIIYNTNAISKEQAPKTLQDLLHPKWKGKIATTPYAAGYEVLADDKSWGEKRLLEYAESLTKNLGGLIRCGELNRIISGEFPIFLLECSPGRVEIEIEKGAPVAQIIPKDMLEILHHWIGVPKHAVNQNAGKLFAAFLVTREAQDIIYKHERTDLHYLEGSRVERQLAEIQKETGQRFGDYTAQRILDQQNVETVLKKLSVIFRVAN
jgi:iron(III) transport system substrate-binding protein